LPGTNPLDFLVKASGPPPRDDALRPLAAAVRRARQAAYNAVPSRHR
jgi:hypothetical protein